MELPHLGQNCSKRECNKLDFLPIKCDACHEIFCEEHYKFAVHNCPNSYKRDNQVPACPLCNAPIPIKKGELPDAVVGLHIDNDCQSDPAKNRRKVFTNKCSHKGCKIKEVIPVICNECQLNFCLKHRHTADHRCEGKPKAQRNSRSKAYDAALQRQKQSSTQPNVNYRADVQGNVSEDEALARALALSEQESDLQLARQLQAESRAQTVGGAGSSRQREGCILS